MIKLTKNVSSNLTIFFKKVSQNVSRYVSGFWLNHPVERKREKNFCSRSQSFHQTWWLEPKIIQLRIIGE